MFDKYFDRLQAWYDSHEPADILISVLLFLLRAVVLLGCVVALFVVAGCKPKQLVSSSSVSQQTLLSERYDSAHSVAGDSATAALLLRCDSMGNVYLAELRTEQGRRLRLELQVGNLQAELKDALNAKKNTTSANAHTSSSTPMQNAPLLVAIDCKEDSFEVVIRGLRERIAVYEEREKETKEPVKYVPKFYKHCTIGFFSLLILLLIAAALLVWKNWAKVAAWVIKIYARIKV